jgi:hypothetical protein
LPNFADTTGDNGKFLFEDLKPGTYQLRAERTGFVAQRYGARTSFDNGTRLSLREGSKLTNLDITLTQQAVILGRITRGAFQAAVIKSRVVRPYNQQRSRSESAVDSYYRHDWCTAT